MDFYDTLKKICIEHNTSVSRLEKDLGFSNGSLSKGIPRADRLYKISQYLNIPMEVFVADDADVDEMVMQIQENLREYLNKQPLYRASAGQGAYNDTYANESVCTSEDGYEYATVVGESMLPELRDGDTVKILRQTETTPHDYTLVKVDGEHATIKFVEIVENGVWLRALNKEVFEDKFFSIQEVMTLPVTILGKVVSFERKL